MVFKCIYVLVTIALIRNQLFRLKFTLKPDNYRKFLENLVNKDAVHGSFIKFIEKNRKEPFTFECI